MWITLLNIPWNHMELSNKLWMMVPKIEPLPQLK